MVAEKKQHDLGEKDINPTSVDLEMWRCEAFYLGSQTIQTASPWKHPIIPGGSHNPPTVPLEMSIYILIEAPIKLPTTSPLVNSSGTPPSVGKGILYTNLVHQPEISILFAVETYGHSICRLITFLRDSISPRNSPYRFLKQASMQSAH